MIIAEVGKSDAHIARTKRWGLITFAPDEAQLNRIKTHLPKINTLRMQLGYDFWQRNTDMTVPYIEWACECVCRALRREFDVVIAMQDTHVDIRRPGLGNWYKDVLNAVDIKMRQWRRYEKNRQRSGAHGQVIAVCLDAEWENSKYVSGGHQAYVDAVIPIFTTLRDAWPKVPIMGPGGTHSDDKTLRQVLAKLKLAGHRFDIVSFHAYSDKGWKFYDKRLRDLRMVLLAFQYPFVAVTECGVTGQEKWGDSLRDGSTEDRHYARFAEMKGRIDRTSWITWAFVYQITEEPAPAGEEHGWGFGLFDSDWKPKRSVKYFQYL